MTIAAWPVARRGQVVHAFKPGEASDSEAPFRTLRRHRWATPGVRITPRSAHRFAGQLTIFSSLNMESARLARHGNKAAAVRVAAAATELEGRPEFSELSEVLSGMPAEQATGVINGVIPADAPERLLSALKNVARLTEVVRDRELARDRVAEYLAGQVKEVREHSVLLVLMSGPETLIPRWMAAEAADRAHVGSYLALIVDKLGNASAFTDVFPAIEVDDEVSAAPFSPFDRNDKRAFAITAADARLLSGDPEPLRILVPVTIEP